MIIRIILLLLMIFFCQEDLYYQTTTKSDCAVHTIKMVLKPGRLHPQREQGGLDEGGCHGEDDGSQPVGKQRRGRRPGHQGGSRS